MLSGQQPRSGGDAKAWPTRPSLHVSVPRDPSATVPTMGLFHVDKDAPGVAHAGCAWLGVGCH
jgi:hypothetical protein